MNLLKTQQQRFLFAGGLNTASGLFLYPILQTLIGPFGVNYMVTLVVCNFAAILQAYALGRWFVFNSRQKPFLEFVFFSAFQWAYFALNLALLPAIVSLWKLDPRIAQFGISLVAMVFSYFWQSRVVFKARHP